MWSYNKKNLIPKLQLRDCPHKIRLVSIVFIGSILAQFLPSFAKISNQTFSLFQEKLTPLTHPKIAVGARWIVLYWKHQFYTVLLLYSKFSNVGDSEKIFLLFTQLAVPSKPGFIELFHFPSWHHSVIPRMHLSFCQQRGEEPDSFWLDASVLLQHFEVVQSKEQQK